MTVGATVRVLLQRADEVPVDDGWLAPEERAIMDGLRVPKRRADWRLGRWTAKRAVAETLGTAAGPPADLRILAGPDGAPEAFVGWRPLPVAISISHRGGLAACAVAPANAALGCDLEVVEARSAGFVADFFTEDERALVEAAPPARRHLLAALVWSAKESALKALRTGLRSDTRSVEVSVEPGTAGAWSPLAVRDRSADRRLRGWWRAVDEAVLTVVADPPVGRPSAIA
ncbi:MAG TPA: 4'-phosphopantetheinyl transferase superfamily protein [Actinomycetota bacterium]|nr:4'-phosphopantetheinyl transferase superfamily protein [Actinomycetota bacterium]